MNPIFLVISYIVIITIVGLLLVSKNKTVQDVFVAKRGLGWFILIPMVMAESIAGTGTVGATAEAMSRGISVVWSTWGLALGGIAFLIFFSKFFKVLGDKKGILSVPAAFAVIFSERVRLLVMSMTCVVYILLFSLQPVAAAAILSPMLGLDPKIIMLLTGAIFILIAIFGGISGLAWTNVIHSFVMIFGLLLVVLVGFNRFGGIQHLKANLDSQYFNFLQPSPFAVFSIAFGLTVSQMGSPMYANICFSSKSLKDARIGLGFGSVLVGAFALLPATIGLLAKVNMPKITPNTALYSFANELSPWLSGIAAMAVIAAIFSTAPALLLMVGNTLTEDFYVRSRPNSSEKDKMRFARISLLIVGIIAIIMSLRTSSIFSAMLGALQIRSIAAVALLAALVWPRVNERAGFWSILVGVITAIIWFLLGSPFGIDPSIPSLVLGVLILVILTLLSPNQPSQGYIEYRKYHDEWLLENKQ